MAENQDERVTEAEFKSAYADMVFAWNSLEFTARFLLEALAGLFGPEGSALSAHIPNKTLTNTIKALSEQFDPDCVKHAKQFCDGFDALCSWRNYYVHGLVGVGSSEGTAVGVISETETKTGRLARVQRTIYRAEIREIHDAICQYASYGSAIVGHVYEQRDRPLFAYTHISKLVAPKTPPRLQRERYYIIDTSENPTGEWPITKAGTE